MKKLRLNGYGSGVLKSQAEKFLMARLGKLEHIPRTDVKKLVHELQLHQIRLAMQHQDLHWAKKSNTEARDRYADLYDLGPAGYFTLDRQGTISEVNLTAARIAARQAKPVSQSAPASLGNPGFSGDLAHPFPRGVRDRGPANLRNKTYAAKWPAFLCHPGQPYGPGQGKARRLPVIRRCVILPPASRWKVG